MSTYVDSGGGGAEAAAAAAVSNGGVAGSAEADGVSVPEDRGRMALSSSCIA